MRGRNSAVTAVVGLLLLAVLGRPTAAFKCGQPNSPCGLDIPKNVTCEKGPGWCEPGYHCSQEGPGGIQCLPVPKDCGKAGNQCCPSNADVPHNDASDKAQTSREPFCRDGSTCWYDYLNFRRQPYVGVTSPEPGENKSNHCSCGTGRLSAHRRQRLQLC